MSFPSSPFARSPKPPTSAQALEEDRDDVDLLGDDESIAATLPDPEPEPEEEGPIKGVHWYHLWVGAGAQWSEPFLDHLNAITKSGLIDRLDGGMISILGLDLPADNEKMDEIVGMIREYGLDDAGFKVAIPKDDGTGQEADTINTMRRMLMPDRTPVFYAHSKGASQPGDQMRPAWRAWLQYHTIERHAECIDAIAVEENTRSATIACAGWHPNDFPVGNYWWATAEQIGQRPELLADGSDAAHWGAETFINGPAVNAFSVDKRNFGRYSREWARHQWSYDRATNAYVIPSPYWDQQRLAG